MGDITCFPDWIPEVGEVIQIQTPRYTFETTVFNRRTFGARVCVYFFTKDLTSGCIKTSGTIVENQWKLVSNKNDDESVKVIRVSK